MADGVVQVVEQLPNKCKALSSNPSRAKKHISKIECGALKPYLFLCYVSLCSDQGYPLT
jgi:hypothetical protein